MPNSRVDKARNRVRCTPWPARRPAHRPAQQELSAHLPRLSPRPQQHEGGRRGEEDGAAGGLPSCENIRGAYTNLAGLATAQRGSMAYYSQATHLYSVLLYGIL